MDNAKIVIVEDEYIVALDIRLHLHRFGYQVPAIFSAGEELLEKIEELRPNLILMDIKLQGTLDGLETARIVWKKYNIPVIMLTAFADESNLERAKAAFPFGYVIKPFEEKELRATIVLALYKHEMENRLRDRERLFSATLSSITDAVFVFDSLDCLDYMNLAAERMIGRSLSAARGQNRSSLIRLTKVEDPTLQARYRGIHLFIEEGKKDRLVEEIRSPIPGADENRTGTLLVLHDLTERIATDATLREREEQLRQVQKMDAVGRLAGGIAHDFNNFLTIIMGYSKMIREECGDDESISASLEGIEQATAKSATLTRQLLMFSRSQPMELKKISLNRLVSDMERMLASLVSDGPSLVFSLDARRPEIHADPSKVEQVLMNLIINARDAMGNAGNLLVRTKNISISETFSTVMGQIPEGEYVGLSVRDTGHGIDPNIVQQIFDPFFTTKDRGRGTGLGLAMVYGIVQQSGAYITVTSNPGKETIFTIYFPYYETEDVVQTVQEVQPTGLEGDETILVVEDETSVRSLGSVN